MDPKEGGRDLTKYIFVTGGVVSGLGKGITAASLGRLLKQQGLKVAAQKLDPYLNIDPGTMSPFQHGEVFVTDDGAETDLDLGHYERFIDENLTRYSNLTSGQVYWSVLNRERTGGYLGDTVQIIPHVTNEIKDFIYKGGGAGDADILITEIGGTVGDIESQAFMEAIRQISLEAGRDDCLFIHVTLVPYLRASSEHKSKPTQHSVKELRAMGISPDIIIARSDEPLEEDILAKIALFCNVKSDCVIENHTLASLYEAPLMLHRNGLDKVALRELSLEYHDPDLRDWQDMVDRIHARNRIATIAIAGKYTKLHDAYLSILESLNHAGYHYGAHVEILWVETEELEGCTEEGLAEIFRDADGILVPGGFGDRGIEGMIRACRFARESDIPYFGICLGMQIAVVEFARSLCAMGDANSGEFDPDSAHKVIDLMETQAGVTRKGGTMRLGAFPCVIEEGTRMSAAYRQPTIRERHRHRYEFNNAFRTDLEARGLRISGTSPDGSLVEAVEVPENQFHLGVQFHPEFQSRPNRPHPLFLAFLRACLERAGDTGNR
jgi:CTP synthase